VSDSATKAGKPKKVRSRGWRIFFAIFKWTRVAILLTLLCTLILGLFLNRVGLPRWVERRIVAQMQARGWDMQFSWLRLHWYRGIVASHLQLSRTNTVSGPNLFVETAEFQLNGRALRSFDLQADAVRLDGARLIWPLPGTNVPRQTFVLNKVQGELLFHTNDHWELRSLQAELLGARIRIRGDVSHASLLRDWKLPARKPRAPGEREEEQIPRASRQGSGRGAAGRDGPLLAGRRRPAQSRRYDADHRAGGNFTMGFRHEHCPERPGHSGRAIQRHSSGGDQDRRG
jgi:hypothetical protein